MGCKAIISATWKDNHIFHCERYSRKHKQALGPAKSPYNHFSSMSCVRKQCTPKSWILKMCANQCTIS